MADAAEALAYCADIFVTQRYAVPDLEFADALIRHCRDHDITLLYDMDDDLRHIPRIIQTPACCVRARGRSRA